MSPAASKRPCQRSALVGSLVLLLAAGCSFEALNRGVEFLGTDDVVLQRGPEDCGMAALANLSLALGTPHTLDELEAGLSVDQDLSLLDMRNVAANYGMRLRGVYTDPRGSAALPAPWVAHFEKPAGHYVVVTSRAGSDWIVADPGAGMFRYTDDALRRRWSGHALIVEGRSGHAEQE